MKVETNFGTYDVKLVAANYMEDDSLAIMLLEIPGDSPFATLTVCLPGEFIDMGNNLAFVDTNNCPWAEKFIRDNELGEPFGNGEFPTVYGYSGFCKYPLYKFNLEKLK